MDNKTLHSFCLLVWTYSYLPHPNLCHRYFSIKVMSSRNWHYIMSNLIISPKYFSDPPFKNLYTINFSCLHTESYMHLSITYFKFYIILNYIKLILYPPWFRLIQHFKLGSHYQFPNILDKFWMKFRWIVFDHGIWETYFTFKLF